MRFILRLTLLLCGLFWLIVGSMAEASAQGIGSTAHDIDTDGDGLSDYAEIHKYFTDPQQADTRHTGKSDGDWEKRCEFTYTISSVLRIARPFDIRAMNDDYQDARILSQDASSCTVEIVYYPLNTNRQAIGENPNWRKDDANMLEYLRPTPTENWDEKMRADLLAELKSADIDPDKLTDKQLVAQVSAWAMRRSKFNPAFAVWFVDFPNGVPTVYPPLREAFDRQKPNQGASDQDMLDHEVLGKQMYYNRVYGSCTSSSIYLTTILRALGIPTRIVVCIPPCDTNDQKQVDTLLAAIHHHKIRATIRRGLPSSGGFANHLFNEVYVGNRWVRLNYSNLGQDILDTYYYGLLTHIATTSSISKLSLAQTWGMRYAKYSPDSHTPESTPRLSSVNPYMLLSVSDHFGQYAQIPNPEVVVPELRTVTISGLYWRDSPELPSWIDKTKIQASDLFISIREWVKEDDYRQLRRFEDRAGKKFLLQAPGHPDVTLSISGERFSDGDGKFQAFGAHMATEDRDKLARGVTYKIVPINTSEIYRWTAADTAILRY
jgi:hypothetical protein